MDTQSAQSELSDDTHVEERGNSELSKHQDLVTPSVDPYHSLRGAVSVVCDVTYNRHVLIFDTV